MLEKEDRIAIAKTMLDAMNAEIAIPMQKLIDCLLIELTAQKSVDIQRLGEQLKHLSDALSNAEYNTAGGMMIGRYSRLISEPKALRLSLSSNLRRSKRLHYKPDWFHDFVNNDGDTEKHS